MGRRWLSVRCVGIAAVPALMLSALMVSALPGAAYAASTKPTVTTTTGMTGIPSHVAAGGTLSFTMTFREQSPDRLYLDGLDFGIWNRCLCGPDDSGGTFATFLDPSVGSWRTSAVGAGDAYGLFFQQRLLVQPGQTVSVPVRLAVGHFRSGSYTMSDNGPQVGDALDSQGNYTPFTWDSNESGDRNLTIGSGTTPGTSPAKAPATHRPTPPAARHTPAAHRPTTPAPARPQSSAPLPPPLASPSEVVLPVLSAAPGYDTSTPRGPLILTATKQAGPSVTWLWLLLPLVLLGAATGIYAHRRRVSPVQSADD